VEVWAYCYIVSVPSLLLQYVLMFGRYFHCCPTFRHFRRKLLQYICLIVLKSVYFMYKDCAIRPMVNCVSEMQSFCHLK